MYVIGHIPIRRIHNTVQTFQYPGQKNAADEIDELLGVQPGGDENFDVDALYDGAVAGDISSASNGKQGASGGGGKSEGGGGGTSGAKDTKDDDPTAAIPTAEDFGKPEIDMSQPCNHLDFGAILPSLGELEGRPGIRFAVHAPSRTHSM